MNIWLIAGSLAIILLSLCGQNAYGTNLEENTSLLTRPKRMVPLFFATLGAVAFGMGAAGGLGWKVVESIWDAIRGKDDHTEPTVLVMTDDEYDDYNDRIERHGGNYRSTREAGPQVALLGYGPLMGVEEFRDRISTRRPRGRTNIYVQIN